MDEFLSLGLLLNRAATAMSTLLNESLAKAGIELPHSQFIVLRCLYYKGDMSQLDIARTLSKDAAAIKRTVDNLEQKGLVERIPVRTLKNSVHITDLGRAIMPKALEVARLASDNVTREFYTDEIVKLKKNLEMIIENIKAATHGNEN